jgi:hypothetical protein
MVVVLVLGCLLRPEMDWCGSFLLSFFLFYLELEDRDSVLRCLGLGGGDLLLAEGLGDGVLGGDLGVLGLFLLEVELDTSVILSSESLLETV